MSLSLYYPHSSCKVEVRNLHCSNYMHHHMCATNGLLDESEILCSSSYAGIYGLVLSLS